MTRQERDSNRALADHYDALDGVLNQIAHFVTPLDGQQRAKAVLIRLDVETSSGIGGSNDVLHLGNCGCPIEQRYANRLRDEIIDAVMRVQALASDEIKALGGAAAADLGKSAG